MPESRLTFFRQSGWLVIATTLGGVFMFFVHKIAGQMPKPEYGVFTTLLQVINLMGIPAIALQTVFAQQTAAAVTDEQHRQLNGTVRAVFAGTFALWLVMVAATFLVQGEILREWKISNPAALWVTVAYGLGALWLPVLKGVLQGKQDFLWFGNAVIFDDVGRFAAITVIVLVLSGYAAGGMTAAVLGVATALAISFWRTRELWHGPRAPFEWRTWLTRVVPLTLGLGSIMFIVSADMLVVQRVFPKEQTGFYAAAGMIGRALVFFTAPLTAVMFPKIAESAAPAPETDVLALTVGATGLLGIGAALVCTFFPTLPLRIIYDQSYLDASGPLVPWFAWCMMPLTLANVLVNNLLARQIFSVVPWLVIIAVAYGVALWLFSTSFLAVIQILGLFALLLFCLAAWFTWRP